MSVLQTVAGATNRAAQDPTRFMIMGFTAPSLGLMGGFTAATATIYGTPKEWTNPVPAAQAAVGTLALGLAIRHGRGNVSDARLFGSLFVGSAGAGVAIVGLTGLAQIADEN